MARDLFQEAGIAQVDAPTGRFVYDDEVTNKGQAKPWEQDWSGKQGKPAPAYLSETEVFGPDKAPQKPWEKNWWENYPLADAGAFADLVPAKGKVRTWGEAAGDTAVDLAKGVVGLGESVVGLGDLATGNLIGKGLGAIGFDPARTKQILSEGYSDARQSANRKVANAEGFMDTTMALIDNPSAAVGSMVESAPMMLGSAGAVRAAATKMLASRGLVAGSAEAAAFLSSPATVARLTAIGSAAEGGMTAGNIQEQGRQAGRDYTDTAPAAVAGGALTGAIGFGTSKIPGFKDAEVGVALAGMGSTKRQGLITAGREIAKGTFKEGVLEEMPQSAQEQAFTNLALGKPWDEGVSEAAAAGMIAGAGMGGGMTTYSAGRNALAGSPRPAAPESAQNQPPELSTQGPKATNSEAVNAPENQPVDVQAPTAPRPEVRLAELELTSEQRSLTDAEVSEVESLATALQADPAATPDAPPEFEDVPDFDAPAPAAPRAYWEGFQSGDRVQTPHGTTGTLKISDDKHLAYMVHDKNPDGSPNTEGGMFSVTPQEVTKIAAPAVAAKPPTDFWAFAREKGIAPGSLQVGTPQWQAVKNEYEMARAGLTPAAQPAPEPRMELQNRDRSRAASVVQMQDIAKNPDYMRLGTSRTPDSGAPMVFPVGDDGRNIPDTNLGTEDMAVMSDGQRVPFVYAVLPAHQVNASNFADGNLNPAFESKEPGTLKALNNGRTAGLQAAYMRGKADKYKAELLADVANHGVPAEVINRTFNPVLVRLYRDADNMPGMAAKSQGQGLSMAPGELARQDAPLLDATVLTAYRPGDVTSAANRGFVRAFIGKLRHHGQDVAAMMTADGQLSPAGRTRIQAALVQAAYGDSDLVNEMFDSQDSDIKAIGTALKTVAGQWADMRDSARMGAIDAQVDITGNLVQAVNLIRKARQENTALAELAAQRDLLTGQSPDPITVGLLRFFYKGDAALSLALGADKVVAKLNAYLQAAMGTSSGAGMFDDAVTVDRILGSINNEANHGQQTQNSGRSAGSSGHRGLDLDAGRQPRDPAGGQDAGGTGAGTRSRTDAQGVQEGKEGDAASQERAGQRGQRDSGEVRFIRSGPDGKSNVLAKNGKFKGWPKFNEWTRQEYNDVVSLLPEAYRNDPHRREPLPTKDRDVLYASVLPELEALNETLGIPGAFRVDDLGNIICSNNKAPAQAIMGQAVALANKYQLGIYVTNTKLPFMKPLIDKGFTGESGLGGILMREAGTTEAPLPNPSNLTGQRVPGIVMSYKPRGFNYALFSRGTSGASLPASTVQQVVDQVTGKWANAPEVVVLASMDDAPAAVRKEYERQNSKGASGSTEGFFYSGKVYLVADQLATPTDAMRVLFHEALGHMGLRGVFGDSLKPILQGIIVARRPEVTAKAKQYGLDMANPADALAAAEEVLAGLAQDKPELAFVKRAIAAIRTWLRANVPGFKDLALTDAEIINSYILPARAFVQGGQGRADGALSFSRGIQTGTAAFKAWFGDSKVVDKDGKPLMVYHGTQANFSVFDAQATPVNGLRYARGFYMTAQPAYASMMSRETAGSNVMPVFASLKNPRVFGSVKEANALSYAQWSEIERVHDGVIIQDDGVMSEVIAFRSEQIKSATGNNGDFDPANPDIRFNRNSLGNKPIPPVTGTQANAWTMAKAKVMKLTSPEVIDKLIYEFQDKFADLKNLRAHIQELGGTITDLNDAYQGEELYHSRLAKRTADFLDKELKPLLADMRSRGVSKEQLENYLHARHAPEANAAMAERNPTRQMIDDGRAKATKDVKELELKLQHARNNHSATKAIEDALIEARGELAKWHGAQAFKGTEAARTSLSGMTDIDAKAFMDSLTPRQLENLKDLAVRVDAIQAETLDTLERYGLMDRASLTAWRKAYQHYVPLHRDEARPETGSHPIGQGFSVKGNASKQRTGSTEKVTNILAHIAMQREAALTRGEKNHVVKKLYLMAAQNPDKDFWEVDSPPMIKTIDSRTGFVRTLVDPQFKNLPNVVMVRIAGNDQAIVFNEHNKQAKRLAEAIKNIDVGDLHVVLGLAAKGTRWFASINTQYNPIFGLVNFARDVQSGLLNLTTTPLAGKQKEVAANIPAAMRAIYRERRGKSAASVEWARLWDEYQTVGGITGYKDMFADVEGRAKALTKELEALDRGEVSKAAHAVVDWLSDYNEAMENSVRLAAYKQALDQGISKERAASLAKNLTVNFNRKGRQAREIGALYAFFNASIQGTARMVDTLKGPVGKRIMYGGVLLGVVNTLIGMAVMGGDDDDAWEQIPEFIKERSIVIPIGRQDYLTIPMPLGFHVFPNIGRIATEFALGGQDKTLGRQLGKLLMATMDSFNPLGGSQNLGQLVSPTVIDPVVALMENKDWTGRPIYRENANGLDPQPGHTMAKDSASSPSRFIAKQVNRITGGTEYRPGAWSPTPDQLDYVIGQLTGGLGRELLKANQTVVATATGDELPPYKVPLLGRLYGNTRGPSGQSGQYYANVKTLNEIENEIKGRLRNSEDAEGYQKSEPLSQLVQRGNVAERHISKIRKVRRMVVEKAEPGYQERVKELDKLIGETMANLNREVAKALRKAEEQP